jgi:hypothetical protein
MMCCTALMSDDALIRRENLRALGKTASMLATDLGDNYSYWAAMLADNSKKPFGEKAARRVEERYNLPRGCLDLPDGIEDNKPRDPGWPFELVDRARYEALSSLAKGAAQMRMMDEIRAQEARASQGNGTDG